MLYIYFFIMKKFLLLFSIIFALGITNFVSFNLGSYLTQLNFQKEAVRVGFAGYNIESEFGWKSIKQVVVEFLVENQKAEPPKVEESEPPKPKDFAL